jgi:phosphotransacetylase
MNEQTANRYDEPNDEWRISAERERTLQAAAQLTQMCSFEQTALGDPEKISENLMDVAFCFRRRHDAITVANEQYSTARGTQAGGCGMRSR